MSRPILSRPRTRVYGCNYDKGESYYKPMVDHLDRKYSGRPLFSEPRTSFADEIAARRSDIGSRNLSGYQYDSYENLDTLNEPRQLAPPPEDTLDGEFVMSHRRFKKRAAAAFEEDLAELRRKRRDMQDRMFDVIDINAEIERARQTLEAADIAFQQHATRFNLDDDDDLSLVKKLDRERQYKEIDIIEKPKPQVPMVKWTKLSDKKGEKAPVAMINRQTTATPLVVDNVIPVKRIGPESKPAGKQSFLKRKKKVSF